MVCAFFIAELFFRSVIDPLGLGSRPIVAAIITVIIMAIFAIIATKILKLK